MTKITASEEELRTTREVARELNSLLDALEKGDVHKFVITQRGKFRGVLVSPALYERIQFLPNSNTPCKECGEPTRYVNSTDGGTWIHECAKGHLTYIGK